jgi:hypothetical protein
MLTDELLLDDDVMEEPEDSFIIPEIKRELTHEPADGELGLRALLEQPERALPERLSRLSTEALYRMYDWNGVAEDEVSAA